MLKYSKTCFRPRATINRDINKWMRDSSDVLVVRRLYVRVEEEIL